MEHWSDIVSFLCKADGMGEIIVAPNAPPVSRSAGSWEVFEETVFTSADVTNLLKQIWLHSEGTDKNVSEPTDAFSFGVRNVGRFRVSRIPQRGSYLLRILRIPLAIPELSSITANQDIAQRLLDILKGGDNAIVLVVGPSSICNGLLVYSLLDAVNKSERRVICILERAMSYLIRHNNSVVAQSELGTDVASMEDGIANLLTMRPDIAFIGDVMATDHLPSLPQFLIGSTCTILSSVAHSERLLVDRVRECEGRESNDADTSVRAIVVVIPEDDGQLRLELRRG